MTDTDDVVHIFSGVQDGKASCTMRWGELNQRLDPDVVLNTARDLVSAAAHAEADIAIMRRLSGHGADMATTAKFIRDVREERPVTPSKVALRIEAVAGMGTGLPYVHIGLGSMKGSLSPDEARHMAMQWTEAAVASNFDARLRYVLGAFVQLTPGDVDAIFTGLRETDRSEGADV